MRRLVVLLVGLLVVVSCGDPVSGDGAGGDAPGEAPSRIVSLSATHTEVLFAIGAGEQVVATDLTSNFPAEAEETPKLDSFNFDVEEVAALDPDLVVVAFDFQGEVAALEALDIPHLLLPPAVTLEEAYDQVIALGTAVGRTDEAAALATALRDRIDDALGSVPGSIDGRSVYHEVDATFYSANSATLLGEVYARLGLENLADDVPDEFGSGYVQLSAEAILDADPFFIVLGDTGFGVDASTLGERPGWAELDAVRSGRILELDPDIAGRWGPRTADLVERVAAWVAERGEG